MPRNTTKRILLVLDGIKQTNLLIDYMLQEINRLPDYQFIIRAHPALPWSSLAARYGYSLDQVPNASVSQRPLPQELKDVDLVVYRQSTVALEVLSMGKPLVNFSPDSELSYDPLHGYSFLKWTLRPGDSLRDILDKIYGLSNEEFDAQYEKAKEFIGQYFYPVTEERVSAFRN